MVHSSASRSVNSHPDRTRQGPVEKGTTRMSALHSVKRARKPRKKIVPVARAEAEANTFTRCARDSLRKPSRISRTGPPQRVAIERSRVRDRRTGREVGIQTYERFQDPALIDQSISNDGKRFERQGCVVALGVYPCSTEKSGSCRELLDDLERLGLPESVLLFTNQRADL